MQAIGEYLGQDKNAQKVRNLGMGTALLGLIGGVGTFAAINRGCINSLLLKGSAYALSGTTTAAGIGAAIIGQKHISEELESSFENNNNNNNNEI